MEFKDLQAIKEKQNHGLTMTEAIRNLRRREIRTPFLLIFTSYLFMFWSGPHVIVFYAVEIFEKVGVSTTNQYLAAIISASVRVLGGVVGIFIIRLMPRVRLAMISMTLLSVSMFTLGAVFYLKQSHQSQLLDILPVCCVALYQFSYGAGVSPLGHVFLGELMPPEYKVLAGLNLSLTVMSIFITTKMFPTLLKLLGPHWTFWMFGIIALISNAFYFFFVPETKGKSLLEIQERFKK